MVMMAIAIIIAVACVPNVRVMISLRQKSELLELFKK